MTTTTSISRRRAWPSSRRSRGFRFVLLDLANREGMEALFKAERFDRVIHLGAQAGVRYSIQNPHIYVDSNVVGTLNVLEGCRHHGVQHLVYASTSSVYGANTKMPFSVHQNVDHPLSLYAATKKANELMAHTYASLYGLPVTGLRFFTVYGPWGRPDMALFLFTKAILDGKPIDVFNYGKHRRDFTYVDDIVGGIVAAVDHLATGNTGWDSDQPGSRHQPGALSPVQHRQRPAGRPDALHRGPGEAPGPQGQRRICCRCRRATCPTPGRTWKIWSTTWAIGPPRRWKSASAASWTGIWITIRSPC